MLHTEKHAASINWEEPGDKAMLHDGCSRARLTVSGVSVGAVKLTLFSAPLIGVVAGGGGGGGSFTIPTYTEVHTHFLYIREA